MSRGIITRLVVSLVVWLAVSLNLSGQQRRVQVRPMAIKDASGQQVGLYQASYALVIGVSNYTAGWPDLPGVKTDIQLIQQQLEKHGFMVRRLVDPDHQQLKEAFQDFIGQYGSQTDNRLMFYFAGHGHTLKLSYGEEMGYIVPADAPNPHRKEREFKQKGLDMQQIEVYAKRIESKHALFVFDSCFSGSIFALSRQVPENISYKTSQAVRQFITSGSAEETVPDRSIFCRQLIAGLEGEGDGDKDGYVTGVELGEYLQRQVVNYSQGGQHPQYGKIRHPKLDQGDFVFEVRRARAREEEVVESASGHQVDPETEMWELIKETTEGSDIEDFLQAFPGGKFAAVARLKRKQLQRQDKGEKESRLTQARPKKRVEAVRPSSVEREKKITWGKDGAKMVLIPAGSFMMGSDAGESDEKPEHRVELDGFYMDAYEVTVGQFREFVNQSGYKYGGNWNDVAKYSPGDEYPMVYVSWNDATAYAKWAGKRLPTEAEWEYAARGGLIGKRYPWGDEISYDDANYRGTGGKDKWDRSTAPVGIFAANGYGLYDMTGNVREWCQDWYGKDYYQNSAAKNPPGPGAGSYRVLRGGSWTSTLLSPCG